MTQIDDSFYSRQRYVLGDNAMRKLSSRSVLLVGVGGLGIEIAKNLVLAGVKSLHLLDRTQCHMHDLSNQFFISKGAIDLKMTRAEAALKQLRELNSYVEINICPHDLDDLTFLSAYQCVIMTEAPLQMQERVDDFCRQHHPSIPFMSADVYGVCAWCFCDFGPSFEVEDSDGEDSKEFFICDVTKSPEGVVTTLEGHLHGLETGDFVMFKEVTSMTALNHIVCPVKVLSPSTFSIIDTTSEEFQEFHGVGMARQVKMKKKIHFEGLKTQLSRPALSSMDFSKPPCINHLFLLTLNSYRDHHGARLPGAWDVNEAESFVRMAREVNEQVQLVEWTEADTELMKLFSMTCEGHMTSLSAFMGGVVAQECLKALSNKFTPLMQWLHTDVREVCPDFNVCPSDQLESFRNTRYFNEIICIGVDLFTKLTNLNLFMVGCGAIGCELLKNFSLLGISTNNGKTTVTDYDLIEKSNLNRQFLFRPQHINKNKSTIAAESALSINPDIHIDSLQKKVCWETESTTFNDSFIRHHDVIVNALDNVEARKYVDGRCVSNERPLLESGTMATKGHVQVIIPFLTESYVSQSDPEDNGEVPYCTLKSFPSNIQHCIEWAREKFESLFVQKVKVYQQYWQENKLEDVLQLLQTGQEAPQKSRVALKLALEVSSSPSSSSTSSPSSSPSSPSSSYSQFIRVARLKFEKYFNHKARDLLHAFPIDTRNNDASLFWQLPKRPPKPITFDPHNALHMTFIKAFAKVKTRASKHTVPPHEEEEDFVLKVLQQIPTPEYVYHEKYVETDESVKKEKVEKPKEKNEDELLKIALQLKENLDGKDPPSLREEEFEKDDDDNGHIDLIASLANLRAVTYGIEEKDRLEIKRIAGKIVPAIATTTAAIAALVSIELVKLVRGTKGSLNYFLNLAVPLFLSSQPAPPLKHTMSNGLEHTQWHKWQVDGDHSTTLECFLKSLKKSYKLEPVLVLHGVKMLFSVDMMAMHKKRLKKPLLSLVKVSDESHVDLVVSFKEGVDGEGKRVDQNGPIVRFTFS